MGYALSDEEIERIVREDIPRDGSQVVIRYFDPKFVRAMDRLLKKYNTKKTEKRS